MREFNWNGVPLKMDPQGRVYQEGEAVDYLVAQRNAHGEWVIVLTTAITNEAFLEVLESVYCQM